MWLWASVLDIAKKAPLSTFLQLASLSPFTLSDTLDQT